jgi:UDP-N-acetylmuramoyl-tripeptide--D-alanyl-D-alanine ligase
MSKAIERIVYGSSESHFCFGKSIDEKTDPIAIGVKILLENSTSIQSHLVGHYNFSNILLAACIGKYFGLNHEEIKKGIENYVPSNSRSQLIKKEKNTIILDAYNANPSSMQSAIENFGKAEFPQKIVILGDMFEMGEYSYKEHSFVAQLAAQQDFYKLIFCGPDFYLLKDQLTNCLFYQDFETCYMEIKNMSLENCTILIKGSRGMALERVLEVID